MLLKWSQMQRSLSKSHGKIPRHCCSMEPGEARTCFPFLPGELPALGTGISARNAVGKFTAFQLQSATSAPHVIAHSSQK